ncbi:MAG: hypothetical protein QOG50_530 [Actinomycetota bacterium]|jgi:plastocyanin|nr:hypothetical protein [Actinomycetota bacterium]
MRIASIRLVLVLAVLAAWIAGAAPAGASSTVAMSVHDFAFSPSTLTVPVGTTVQITNTGQSTHTWSSDPGDAQQWDSGPINPGSSFSVTFNGAGQFGFHCNIHPYMTGTVVVVASTPSTTAAPTTVTTPATTAPSAPVMTTPISAPSPSAGSPIGTTAPPTATAQAAVLAHTGASNVGVLLAAAAILTLLGIALVASGRRRPA